MKYCYQCGRVTPGEPLFCNSCGRSYDVKLCPRHHPNPRSADVCSQCGSRELSTPQPRVSLWWKVLQVVVQIILGVVLVYVSLALLGTLLRTPVVQGSLVVLGILIGLLWWLWSELPEWFRKLIRKSYRRKERDHER
jgi:hypothetical protein